jgi:hypothetical protein
MVPFLRLKQGPYVTKVQRIEETLVLVLVADQGSAIKNCDQYPRDLRLHWQGILNALLTVNNSTPLVQILSEIFIRGICGMLKYIAFTDFRTTLP